MRLLSLALICLPLVCHAEEKCPWLNRATAGGILGGEVSSATVKRNTPGDATCVFVRREGSTVAELRIATETRVHKDFASYAAARCGSESRVLKAIGNEALACGDGEAGEQVVGRVREMTFVIELITTDRPLQRSVLREKVRSIAEQVAGILF